MTRMLLRVHEAAEITGMSRSKSQENGGSTLWSSGPPRAYTACP